MLAHVTYSIILGLLFPSALHISYIHREQLRINAINLLFVLALVKFARNASFTNKHQLF